MLLVSKPQTHIGPLISAGQVLRYGLVLPLVPSVEPEPLCDDQGFRLQVGS